MKKKEEGKAEETFAIHRRAARDMRRVAPGCFAPVYPLRCSERGVSYAVIWLFARLIDELSTLRRPEILGRWVFGS